MRMSHAKVTCEWTLFADITQYVQFFVNYFLSSIYHAEFRKYTRFHKDQLPTHKNMAPLTYKAMYVRMQALSPSTHFWQILGRVPISFPNLNYWIRQDESSGGDYFLSERKSWKSVRHRYKGPLTPKVHVLITTVFVETRLWKTKHSRKRFQNVRQSYVLSTCRIEIHQSQPASMT